MSSRTDYRDIVRGQPDLFANPPGAAFEILLDEDEIQQVEAHIAGRLVASGGSAEWARVGVVFRDQYLLLLRDAVRSSDGSLGTYIRFVPHQPERPGVVTLPIWQGRVLLIRHFRHATRSWHLEIPRGFGISTDTEESALHELREEIGAVVSRLVALGEIYPDAGASAQRVALFLAEVASYGEADHQEGITEILPTPIADFERMIAGGELADGFLLAAYARAKARDLV
jgi:ADP-ribose pyrophosphatase